MTAFSATPPSEYWPNPGQKPKRLWNDWYADFELYGEASGWDDWSDSRRKALLLHCVGAEARRLFRAVDTESAVKPEVRGDGGGDAVQAQVVTPSVYDRAVQTLTKLFVRDSDVRTERVRFRRCVQISDQSCLIYLANLKERVLERVMLVVSKVIGLMIRSVPLKISNVISVMMLVTFADAVRPGRLSRERGGI